MLTSLAAFCLLPLGAHAQTGAGYASPSSPRSILEGLQFDANLGSDSNVTRSRLPSERLSDQVIGVQLSGSRTFSTGSNSQTVYSGFAGLEQWRRFRGLGKAYVGGEAEFQYRTSEAFDAPTFGLSTSATAENYQSTLRDGIRLSVGANVQMALTDRINLFAALARNVRSASSPVFDSRDSSLRLHLDYALAAHRNLYLSGEYRRGDVVAAGLPAWIDYSKAKAWADDDAFTSVGYDSYRIKGRTALFTLGYNHALGTQDALDISWRRIRSTPSASPAAPFAGPAHYLSNQITLVYLKRF